jgi:hypothetical protein
MKAKFYSNEFAKMFINFKIDEMLTDARSLFFTGFAWLPKIWVAIG